MNSYSVRCIFRWEQRQDQKAKHLYEERITLWLAESFNHAIELAEQEAEDYASENMEFLGYSQAYELFESTPINGIEVFSLLRESDLDSEKYINTFFDTGREREGECEPSQKL